MPHYLVQVHVIQALNLIPTSSTNTAIPVCEVECWGEKKQTKKGKEKTLNPFWDRNFNFERQGVDLSSGENFLKLTVYDVDTWFTSDKIGEYVIDLAHVYNEEPDHELYRKWVVLGDGEDDGDPLGFLKVSVLVLNVDAGDAQPARDAEDPFADPETDNAEDLESAMLKPPNMKKDGYHLHCQIWEAQDLPIMDYWGTVDPYVRVGFSGTKKLTTDSFKKEQNPKFKTQLTLKVGKKAPTDVIMLELLDEDVISDELISNRTFSYKKLIEEGGEMAPRWFPLYGHLEEPDLNEVLRACYKKQMNEPPRTRYVGRLLVGFKADYHEVVKAPEHPKQIMSGGPAKPREVEYTLRVDVYQGASLDDLEGWFENILVQVQWGNEVRTSEKMYKDRHGIACWFEGLEEIVSRWPEIRDPGDFPTPGEPPTDLDDDPDWGDWDQLPFVVIRLLRDGVVSTEVIAEKVLHPKDIPPCVDEIDSSSTPDKTSPYRPKWYMLDPVRKKSGKLAIEIPTFIQLRIGLNTELDPAGVRSPIVQAVKKPYVLRSHCFQARGLAAADRGGTSDPYVEVQCGNYRKTTRRNERTLCPLWYETLTGRIFMPSRPEDIAQSPMINVSVWDWEEGLLGFSADTIIGRQGFEIDESLIVCQWDIYRPRKPEWCELYDIIDGKKVQAGEILISFDIMHPALAKEAHHKFPDGGSLVPYIEFVPMFLEYRILGLRDLLSLPGLFSHAPVRAASIRIKCGFAEWEDVVDYEWINLNKARIYSDEDLLDKKKELLSYPMMQTPILTGTDEPNGANPHFGQVGYLKFNYPLDKRFMPNIVVECLDRHGQLIGSFDTPLDEVMHLQRHGPRRGGQKDETLKLALEQNGIDPSSAIDKGAKVDGKEAELEVPEVEEEDGEDYLSETDEEMEKKKEEERKVQEKAGKGTRRDNEDMDEEGNAHEDDEEKKEPDHEPIIEYPEEYDCHYKRLPYSRFVFKRQAPVAFNPFTLTFDRTPRQIQSGVFKGTFRVLKPVEIPGRDVLALLQSRWGQLRGEPEGELTDILEFGDPDEFLEWTPRDPSMGSPVCAHIKEKPRYMKKPVEERPLFYYGVDTKEGAEEEEDNAADEGGRATAGGLPGDSDEDDGLMAEAGEMDEEEEYDLIPTTSLDRGGEVHQWFWDRQQAEWEDFFTPQELTLRAYVYNAYYLVGKRGNDTNPVLLLSVPDREEHKTEKYPAEGAGKTAWPMVLRTLSPNFRHTFSDIPITLPGAGVCTLSVLDRDEGIILTTETEIGFTKFDIEDQAYDGYFSEWKLHRKWAYYTWPTQTRALKSHTSKAPMGKVKMFTQILDAEDSLKYKPINIKGPGPMDFELRATIFGLQHVRPPPDHEGEEVPRMVFGCLGAIPCFPCLRGPNEDSPHGIICCPGGLNLQVAVTAKWSFPEAEEDSFPKGETDVQKAVSFEDMSAAFNWRIALPVTLPCKFHFIQINVYSTKTLGFLFSPDSIAENVFNLKAFFDKALDAKGKKPVTIQLPAHAGGKWINLTHPKRGDQTMAQISLHMEIISKELLRERETEDGLQGSEAWDQVTTWPTQKISELSEAEQKSKRRILITKPERPPVDFWWFNVIGWGRWCLYRHFWRIIIAGVIGLIVLVGIIVLYMQTQ